MPSKTRAARSRKLVPSLLAASVAIASPALWAGPADLDPGFGTGGIDASFAGWNDITTFVPQGDGRWLLGGARNVAANDLPCPSDWIVFRRGADGGADASFAGTGTLDLPVGSVCAPHQTQGSLEDLVVQSDGRLLGVGHGLDAGNQASVRLTRWNADGSLDTGYHGTGKVALSLGAPAISSAIALQKDGKAVVAGTLQSGSPSQVYVLRFNANGTRDLHFAGSGMFTVPGAGATLAMQSDGRILVGIASIQSGSSNVPEIVRLTSTGQLDATFGGSGIVGLPVGTNVPAVLAQQPDGRIVGTVEPFGGTASYVFRLMPDGSLDTSFNGQGFKALGLSDPRCMVLTPTGQVLVAGVLWDFGANHDWLQLARLTPTGQMDAAFTSDNGDSGQVRTGQAWWCSRMQLQPDGRIAIAGLSNRHDWKQPAFAARFIGDAYDLQPDAFAFTPATGVPTGTTQTSNAVTIAGLTPGAKVPVLVTGGLYRVNASPFTSALGYVGNGDTIRLRHTSAATGATTVTTTLQVGGTDSPESPWVVRGATIHATFASTTQ